MWPIIKKEAIELALAAFPLVVIAAVLGASEIAGRRDHTPDMLEFVLVAGLVLGVAQGLLDRLRRDHHFLLHRPLSIARHHSARTLAGAALCLIVVLVLFISVWTGTWHEQSQVDRARAMNVARALRYEDPVRYPLFAHVISVALCLGAWAVARFVIGIRHPVKLALGGLVSISVAWSILARTEGWSTAWVSAAFLLLFGVLTHTSLTRRRGRLRTALVCVVVIGAGLEALFWARNAAADFQRNGYPAFGMTAAGEVKFWWGWGQTQTEYDADRSVIATRDRDDVEAWPSRGTVIAHNLHLLRSGPAPWDHVDRAGFLARAEDHRQGWRRSVAAWLNASNRGLTWAGRASESVRWADRADWRYEGGRFVCRRGRRDGEILAGFGPDGYTDGPGGAAGEAFGDLEPVFDRGGALVLLDWTARVLVALNWPVVTAPEAAQSPYEPIRVEVTRAPFELAQREPIGTRIAFVREGELFLVDERGGLFGRWPFPDDEALRPFYGDWREVGRANFPRTRGDTLGFFTVVKPCHPTRYRVRMRRLQAGSEPVVGEAFFEPRRFTEHLPEVALGATASARPALLNLLAFFSAGPTSFEAMRGWWWRDPLLSEGNYLGVLLLSLALALGCAAAAGWMARSRCATREGQLAWIATAFLLGPLGLLCMRWTRGATAVEPVGGAVRAVDLDATPSNDAPWPTPEPTGLEVIERPLRDEARTAAGSSHEA